MKEWRKHLRSGTPKRDCGGGTGLCFCRRPAVVARRPEKWHSSRTVGI